MENQKRKVEIFSAGCSACHEAVELVKRIAGFSHEIEIVDMHRHEAAARAKHYGIRSVPAVVIDGRLAACCANRGVSEKLIREALEGQG
jgi:glutaredoxin